MIYITFTRINTMKKKMGLTDDYNSSLKKKKKKKKKNNRLVKSLIKKNHLKNQQKMNGLMD